jgi:hypothetical protein
VLDHRVGVDVAHQAQGVAEVARPEDGQHQEGPFAHAPHAEGLAEVFVVLLEPQLGGNVEGAQEAHGAVHQHPPAVGEGFGHLALEQVVHPDPDIAQVAEEIADHRLDRQRRVVVDLRHRADHEAVGLLVELEGGPVEGLEGSFGCPPVAQAVRPRPSASVPPAPGPRFVCCSSFFIIVPAMPGTLRWFRPASLGRGGSPSAALSNMNWLISFSSTTADWVF